MEKQISELKDHYIISDYGRIGSIIVAELHAANIPLIVLAQDPEQVALLEQS